MRKLYYLIIAFVILFSACERQAERHLNLGKWYFEKGLINEAIIEFKSALRIDDNISAAHYYLAICFVKKEWYEYALKEAEKAFELEPTDDHYSLIQIIKKKMSVKEKEVTE